MDQTKKLEKSPKTKLVVPDGGWGWIVLAAALTVNALIAGTIKSFGVLFAEYLDVFQATPSAGSWIAAFSYFLYNALGPVSSAMSTKYSYKTTTLVGGAFAAGGMMISYFATSIAFLYFSYGVLVGIGGGLTFPPTIYIVTSYFERLRGFATGLCFSGSAIGTIVLSPTIQYLLDLYGHQITVLIVGIAMLSTLICALAYHPVERHMKEVEIEDIDNEALSELSETQTKTQVVQEGLEEILPILPGSQETQKASEPALITVTITETPKKPALSRNNSIHSSKPKLPLSRQHSIVSEVRPIAQNSCNNLPDMFCRLFRIRSAKKTDKTHQKAPKDTVSESSPEKNKFFDFSILKDPVYLVILISNGTTAITKTNFITFLPLYANLQGFDKNMSALLLSIISGLDIVGRIGGPSLSDLNFIPKYWYYTGGLVLNGVALVFLPLVNNYGMLSFFCALFGLSSGVYTALTTVVLADMLGVEKLSSSYGMTLFVNGVLQLVGPPICGVVFEQIGSYKPIFMAFGVISLLGSALCIVLPFIKRWNRQKIENSEVGN